MQNRDKPAGNPSTYRANPLSHVSHPAAFLLTAVVWSLLVLFSLWTQREQLNRARSELARIDAIANLEGHGDPQMGVPGRRRLRQRSKAPNIDSLSEQEHLQAIRPTGETLKLVSITSIHILLGIQEISNKEYGNKERLTSLQLRNRDNAPDEWETRALKSLRGRLRNGRRGHAEERDTACCA